MEPSLPPTMILFLAAAALGAARYLHLRWRDRRRDAGRAALHQALTAAYAGLRAAGGSPAAAVLPPGWQCRPLPGSDPVKGLDADKRLLLWHEAAPRQLLPRFPGETPARAAVFADGRVEIFAEDTFKHLVAGDNVLRARLGLPTLDIDGNET